MAAVLVAQAFASPVAANPLAGMAGAWTGTGWALEQPGAPTERVRCRLDNTYDAKRDMLDVTGMCAAPGRRVRVEGSMRRENDGRISGFWHNPDGFGRPNIHGAANETAVAFTFNAGERSRIVTWRLTGAALQLTTVDGDDETTILTDVAFER